MPRRSIFIKIYLCFWLATSLVVAAQIGLDRLTPPGPSVADHLKHALSPTLTVYGHTALEYHVLGDHTALTKATDQLKRSTGIDAYLIDEMDRDASNRSLSQEVLSIALRAKQTSKTEFSSSKDKALLALPLKGADGKDYRVVGEIPLPVFGNGHRPPPDPSVPGPRPKPPFLSYGPGPPPLPFLLGPGPPPPPSTPLSIFRWFMTLAISGGVCYWLARYLTSPVIKLRDATRRFADGELTVRVGESTSKWRDELSELADDFDHMAERIGALMNQQRQLLRDVSHELRSPLTRLNLAVELSRRQVGAEAATTLNRIETEAELMNEMIGQVLTLSRLESDIEGIRMVPVDLTKLVTEIAADADFEAHARECVVELVEDMPCTVSGNEELLRRAIENVVRNAVSYTDENTTVEIRIRRIIHDLNPYAEISVRDHGPGVPEADLPQLFRAFYRVSNARERQTGGTGLGLAITKRAVSLHHGFVRVSNASDGGLIAVIQIPLSSDLTTPGT